MAALKILLTTLLVAVSAASQQPPVRVNVMNICAPPAEEQKQIAAALARIPRRPVFAKDFEVARGISTAPETPASRWVRIRREFGPQSPFTNVQYSFSTDDKESTETLALHLRDPKDVMQISVESHTPGNNWKATLTSDHDAGRVKLERFGKPSVGLARCQGLDQASYEPLFRAASEVLRRYRAELNAIPIVGRDLQELERPPARHK